MYVNANIYLKFQHCDRIHVCFMSLDPPLLTSSDMNSPFVVKSLISSYLLSHHHS